MLVFSDLLQPIPGPNPSGEDTRYTADYEAIKEGRREDPDLPPGDWKHDRKIADWGAVANLCTHILINRTKDLWVAAWLTEALVHRDGFVGLTAGLNVLRGLIDQFWSTLYPRVDEDELEFRAAPLEWIGTRLDAAVKSVALTPTGVESVEAVEHATSTHFRVRLNEVDSSLAALGELYASSEPRFGDMSPRFDGLRTSLSTVRLLLENLMAKTAEKFAREPCPNEDTTAPAEAIGPVHQATISLDLVHFTLTGPVAINPGASFVLTLWVHLESQRATVVQRACQQHLASQPAGIMFISKGPVRIERGVMLTVRLEVSGAILEDPEDSLLWDGEIGCANFVVALPANGEKQIFPGKAVIYLNGALVAKVQFVLHVGAARAGTTIPTMEMRVRKAFASYASADRDEVLGRLQGIRKAAPYLEIFFDVLTLRSGQNWAHDIETLIPASDVFYLFWSVNAIASVWVEQEWRAALRTGRRDFIDPVPLQSPEEAPPPPELAGLHFNDWMLAFQRRKLCHTTNG